MTPGRDLASVVSIEVILACAIGLRSIARCSMPGSVMLSVHVVRPVMRCWSSLRLRDWPISAAALVDGGHALAPAAAAAWAARTMFW